MTKQILFILILSINILEAAYVGDKACQSCHQKEHSLWHNSYHDLAMQEADLQTVLGDFNTTFEYNGIQTKFYKQDKTFMVRTDGPDGQLHDYKIAYTFGVYPLQQYLVPFPDGKYQVLDIAWDSRKKEEGGQRWFHLHPNDKVTAGHPFHWTGANLNWNFMCADCHSTNLKKNYDPQSRTYNTTYDVINVSCEACHGPGEEHLQWAKNPQAYKGTLRLGLSIDLWAMKKQRWKIDPKTKKPINLQPVDHSEIEVCARCHSRRSQLDDNMTAGMPFGDHYLPSPLASPLYFPDGKIEDEVYVYGSFLQSKMYDKGVTCSDCHDPHSLNRRAEGDNVCNRCHDRIDYDTPKHHHHTKGDASCIDCHMPPRTYMGVDVRNDHSFRIPRPDLSVGSDTPNACNICHKDKEPAWAADAIRKWYGKVPVGNQNFAHQMIALRHGSKKAPQSLYDVLGSSAPDIAKATVAAHLGDYPNKQTYTTTLQMLGNSDGMIRLNALEAFEAFPLQMRIRETFKMLDDPLKMVRVEAARQLSAIPQGEIDAQTRSKLEAGIEEFRKTLLFNAERAESQTALGTLYANLNQNDKAKAAYEEALRLQPYFVPAYINFANFYQKSGNEEAAYEILKKGLEELPEDASIHHALGLWYVRHKDTSNALSYLKQSAALDSDNSRYQYVYAIALADTDLKGAIKVLEASLQKHTGDIPTLYALSSYYEMLAEKDRAQEYRKEAEALRNFVPKFDSMK